MLKNNPIKYRTDTTGFLLIITAIPHMMEIKESKLSDPSKYPLLEVSFKINRFCIVVFFIKKSISCKQACKPCFLSNLNLK